MFVNGFYEPELPDDHDLSPGLWCGRAGTHHPLAAELAQIAGVSAIDGLLADDALLYLHSRGIALVDARTMLIDAFTRDITDSIAHDALRAHVTAIVVTDRVDMEQCS